MNFDTIKVTNFQAAARTITEDDPEVKKLLPTVNIPVDVSFNVEGLPDALANSLRRVIKEELPVKSLTFDLANFESTNPFLLSDEIRNKLRNLYCKQTVSKGQKFSLVVENKTPLPINFYTGDIKAIGGGGHIEKNILLGVLEAGTYIKIKDIIVEENYGYIFAGSTLVSSCAALWQESPGTEKIGGDKGKKFAENVKLVNAQVATTVSVSDNRKHTIKFTTHGTEEPKQILTAAIKELAVRFGNVKAALHNIKTVAASAIIKDKATEYAIHIEGENATTGQAISKFCDILNPPEKAPELVCVPQYKLNAGHGKNCGTLIIRIITKGDPKEIIGNAIDAIVKCVDKLGKEFNKL